VKSNACVKRASFRNARERLPVYRPRGGMLPSTYTQKRRKPDSQQRETFATAFQGESGRELESRKSRAFPHDCRNLPARRFPEGIRGCFRCSTRFMDYKGVAKEGNKKLLTTQDFGG
jgi:hypothetical protein